MIVTSKEPSGTETLPRSECLTLLASRQVGRVAVSQEALPAIFPVRYRLVGGDIVFAAVLEPKSSTTMNRNVIAFGVDDLEAAAHRGWSVLVVGVARCVLDSEADWQAAPDRSPIFGLGCQAAPLMRLSTDRVSGWRQLMSVAWPSRRS